MHAKVHKDNHVSGIRVIKMNFLMEANVEKIMVKFVIDQMANYVTVDTAITTRFVLMDSIVLADVQMVDRVCFNAVDTHLQPARQPHLQPARQPHPHHQLDPISVKDMIIAIMLLSVLHPPAGMVLHLGRPQLPTQECIVVLEVPLVHTAAKIQLPIATGKSRGARVVQPGEVQEVGQVLEVIARQM